MGCPDGRRRAGGHCADAGFTLVEVIVAMAVFAMVSTAALTLVVKAAQTIRANSDRVYAAALARGALDSARAAGAGAQILGRSTTQVTSGSSTFTVATTTQWEPLGQAMNVCQVGGSATPAKTYMRVTVEVTGGDIGAPQTVVGLIPPDVVAPSDNTGSIAVSVVDDRGQPVSAATVSGEDGAGHSFLQVTGPDGCIFEPAVITGSNWLVKVVKDGYITQVPAGNITNGIVVIELKNTHVGYVIAQPGTLLVRSGSEDYPVPAGVPFSVTPDPLNVTPTSFAAYANTVTGLWPGSYSLALRPCASAPEYSTSIATVSAGASTTVGLNGIALDLVGPKDSTVTAVYDGPCAATVTLGAFAADHLMHRTLPYGHWHLSASGAAGVKEIDLRPGARLCSLSWPVPGVGPRPTATATPTATESATATPTSSAGSLMTPTPTPSPTEYLPEVSEPCQ